jgi:hypothetical protein
MTTKTNALVNIGVTLKAQLEIRAEQKSMKYRDYLAYLADTAVEQNPVAIQNEPTKQTRLTLSIETKDRVRRLSKQASCTQEQWLLNVFQTAVQDC